MQFITLKWFWALLAAYLICTGADLYLTEHASAGGAPERVTPAEFLEAAEQGQLSGGVILYRPAAGGLARLTARRIHEPDARGWQTMARLADPDVAILRRAGFAEEDGAVPTEMPASWSARGALAVHGLSEGLGMATLAFGLVWGATKVVGRHTSFSAHALRAAKSTVPFAAVAGCDEAKDEVYEVVEFLKNPERFSTTGGRMPKGVLLVGPPGTGKTMLAKAVAGEAKAHFYCLSGADFVELYVGVGASRVRSLFKQARKTAPSIIFIDEIDALGRKRSTGDGTGAQQEHDQTLNALLVEMDGFETDDAVVVFGATNRPETLDKALLRPGRFDRRVSVGLPDLAGRKAILAVHARSVKLAEDVDLERVAKSTPGYSGADLANLLNEGAIQAARAEREAVTMKDLSEARDRINWGRETPRRFTLEEKRVIAYHEAGHALVQVLAGDDTSTLQKVTTIPRGQSLGSTHFLPERDMYNFSQEQLVRQLRCLMGGRAAEEIGLGSVTSGAAGDIAEATRLARQMVFEWGMSPLGFMALAQGEGAEGWATPQTLHEAEGHMRTLLSENYQTTQTILRESRAALEAIAQSLMDRETLSGDEVRRLVAENRRAA